MKVPKQKTGGRIGKDARAALSASYSGAIPGPGAYEARSGKGTLANPPRYSYVKERTIVSECDPKTVAFLRVSAVPAQEHTI